MIDLEAAEKVLRDATPEARAEARDVFTRAAGIAGQWFGSGVLPEPEKIAAGSLKDALATAAALNAGLDRKIQAKKDGAALALEVARWALKVAEAAAIAAVV